MGIRTLNNGKNIMNNNKTFRKFLKTQKKTQKKLLKSNSVLNEGYEQTANKIYIKKSKACYITDYDNNTYIDTAMGGGSFLLGHNHKQFNKALKKYSHNGSLYTLPNFYTHKIANLLTSIIPHFKRFVFCSTGSEATMRAIRIARSYSNKSKIAIFSGGWHGSHDMLLIDETYQGKEGDPEKILKSNGSLKNILDDIILLPYNHENAFKIIEKNKNDLAMVLIEPIQGSNPRDDMKEFLQKLRHVTEKNNILLGFDEIITGFRIALGGGQEYYGIKADLATYGKAIGGGLPLAIVAGEKDIMDSIKKGNPDNKSPVFMGGTFSANPLSISVGYRGLKYLIKNQEKVYSHLNKQSKYLKDSINRICEEEHFSGKIMGTNSMLRFIFTQKDVTSRFTRDKHELSYEIQNTFYTNMLLNGVHIASNRINFISLSHKKHHIDKIIKAYKESILLLKKQRLI
jgi:glutamate-1-semialdehyde 2,1-aminomutase